MRKVSDDKFPITKFSVYLVCSSRTIFKMLALQTAFCTASKFLFFFNRSSISRSSRQRASKVVKMSRNLKSLYNEPTDPHESRLNSLKIENNFLRDALG